MNENKDFEFLSEEELKKLDKGLKDFEKIELPEGLSPEKIQEKIDAVPQLTAKAEEKPKKKRNKKKIILSTISAAAAVIVAVTSVMILAPWENTPPPQPQQSVVGDEPQNAEDYAEIEKLFAKYAKNYKSRIVHYNGAFDFDKGAMEIITDDALQENISAQMGEGSAANINKAPAVTNKAPTATSPVEEGVQDEESRFGETNEQVAGVSEADIIKNDGKYIYAVNPENADWEKFYTELENTTFDESGVTGTTAKAESTPPYNPFAKSGEQETEEAKAEEKKEKNGEERPVLDYSCSVSIIEPNKNGKLSEKAVVTIEKPDNDEFYFMSIQEIYVKGSRLVVILNCNKYDDSTATYNGSAKLYYYTSAIYGRYNPVTMAVAYDLSDLNGIKEEWRIYQEGSYISSRLIGDELVLLTNYYVDISKDEETVKESCIPEISVDDANLERIPKDSICIMDEVRNSGYLVASVMDVKDKNSLKTQAVLGGGENVYCTTETLYVTSTDYDGSDSVKEIFGVDSGEMTQIYKFDIRNYDIKHVKNASVSGSALNQFSIDEYNGYLRIATTLGSWGENLVNQLYVLDESLETKGLLKDIAKGERIKSVRFTGETAYVVTFVQTDPLFVIDLSKPDSPTILGELKIPGYSAYLHPVGQGLVMGVGLDGTESGTNGGLKASLFDVSDPKNPKECGKFVLSVKNGQALWEYIDSAAYSDHKALCWDNEEKIMYIPFVKTTEVLANVDTYQYRITKETGVIALKVDETNKELKLSATYKTEAKETMNYYPGFERSTYIDNIVFAFSHYDGTLCSFDKETAKAVDTVKLGE